MTEPVTYRRTDLVSTVTMDDGKVNVFSIPMLRPCTRRSTKRSATGRSSC